MSSAAKMRIVLRGRALGGPWGEKKNGALSPPSPHSYTTEALPRNRQGGSSTPGRCESRGLSASALTFFALAACSTIYRYLVLVSCC